MTLGFGCDEAALGLKQALMALAQTLGHTPVDYGCYDETPVLYPDIAFKTAEAVAKGECERAVLVCGTGIGMAISANKVPGIRAAVCHDIYSAQRAMRSNDCQIACFGARVVGVELAKTLLSEWLNCQFDGGGSMAKVARIQAYEDQVRKGQ